MQRVLEQVGDSIAFPDDRHITAIDVLEWFLFFSFRKVIQVARECLALLYGRLRKLGMSVWIYRVRKLNADIANGVDVVMPHNFVERVCVQTSAFSNRFWPHAFERMRYNTCRPDNRRGIDPFSAGEINSFILVQRHQLVQVYMYAESGENIERRLLRLAAHRREQVRCAVNYVNHHAFAV